MKIQSGLFPGQVLQRNARQGACARISGSCNATTHAMVEVSVRRDDTVLPGVRGSGEAVNGAWQAWTEELPVGGPYEIRFRLPEEPELSVADIRAGDLWLFEEAIQHAPLTAWSPGLWQLMIRRNCRVAFA